MRHLRKAGKIVSVITSPREARNFVADLREIAKTKKVAIDFETTGLHPDNGQVRLSCISYEDNKAVILDHFECGSFASFAEDLAEIGPWLVFNAMFEGRWFDHETLEGNEVVLWDVGYMRKACQGGGPLSLALQVKWDLGITLDKELQNSNWAGPLSASQYFYGGCDAIYTRELGELWLSTMTPEQFNGFHVINDAWRATLECEETGFKIDEVYHRSVIKMLERRRNAAEACIRRMVPEEKMPNIRSKQQITKVLREVLDDEALELWPTTPAGKQMKLDRKFLTQMSYNLPYPLSRFLAALMVFNRADKYLSSYGEVLITKQQLSTDGRMRTRFNIAAAVTGRYSSSNPNVQSTPRAPMVRHSFIAGEGCRLIMADYSGIEIRVLAELAQDLILLHDCIYGNVHAQSAIAIYKLIEEHFMALLEAKNPVAKEQRSKAKGFTFQLLYGAAAAALSVVLRCTFEEAEEAIMSWARRYSKAYGYRQTIFEKMNYDGYIPCKSGRTIYVPKRDRSMPVAANYPIQGSAGDVMYRAMYHCREMLVASGLPIYMMATVHDEIILWSQTDDEEINAAGAKLLEEAMIKGWLDIFPDTNTDNLVEAAIGVSWADKA